MISRHDEVPRGQRIEESSGAAKLSAACALRQIAGDHDEVRAKLRQHGLQRADQCLVDAAEVQVRQMRQHAHGVDFSATPPRHSTKTSSRRCGGRLKSAPRVRACIDFRKGAQRPNLPFALISTLSMSACLRSTDPGHACNPRALRQRAMSSGRFRPAETQSRRSRQRSSAVRHTNVDIVLGRSAATRSRTD